MVPGLEITPATGEAQKTSNQAEAARRVSEGAARITEEASKKPKEVDPPDHDMVQGAGNI